MSIIKKIIPILALMMISIQLTGCSMEKLVMAPLDEMPAQVQDAPSVVQQAYQFAAANPEVLMQIPCYCGCGAMGHRSNYACYVSEVDLHGAITYDDHALGCSICVDITQDTMRLFQQGKTLPDIKTYIDKTYAQYGSTNIP